MQPSVISVMTPFPKTIPPSTPLIAAVALMAGHEIKHLPVLDGDHVLGVVTESDLRLGRSLLQDDQAPVSRLCSAPPLALAFNTSLWGAVKEMARAGVDAAIVMREGRLAGILTLTDISRALLRIMPQPFFERPPTGPRSA